MPSRTIRARPMPSTIPSSGGAIDPAVPLPLDKLNWMQTELVKAGNLKTPIDLAKITDANIRAEAAKRAAK